MEPRLDTVENVPATTGGVRSRNVLVGDRRTGVRFDAPTWRALQDIKQREAITLDELCTLIDEAKPRQFSLTATIRCYVVGYLIEAATARGRMTSQRRSRSKS